jgi:hypothetical protein
MKFTQKQIDIITEEIISKINNKKKIELEKIQQSEDYQKHYDIFVNNHGFKHLYNFIQCDNEDIYIVLNNYRIDSVKSLEERIEFLFENYYFDKIKFKKFANFTEIKKQVEKKLYFINRDFNFDEFVRGFIEGY